MRPNADSATPLRVLILEDNPDDAELVARRLKQAGLNCSWQRVETEADYAAQLDPRLDLILADYTLPQYDALRALQHLQARQLDIPFIVTTGMQGEEAAVECMKYGAADYLLKDRLARLGPAVVHALEQKRLRAEKRRAEAVQAVIYKIAQAAITVLNLPDLFTAIHASLSELIPVDNFFIALYDPAREELSFAFWRDEHDPPPQPRKLGRGLTEYVLRTGRPQWVPMEVLQDLIARGEVTAVGTPAVDWVGVPLKVEDRTIGVMAVQSYTQSLRLTQVETDILSFLSAQAAMVIERKRAEEAVQHLATTDPLTGLYNRRHFFELGQREFKRARRYLHPLSLLMLDVDNLKPTNDTAGHLAGDWLLQSVAQECLDLLRRTDLLGRYGGDEFVALLPETELQAAQQVIERVCETIAQKAFFYDGRLLRTSISVGLAALDADCASLETLLGRADQALYAAKQAGKNRVLIWKA